MGDAGYALSNYVLTLYRGVRYHLVAFAQNGLGPVYAKELFNLRHSSLRNCVERLYGITKRRFPVFKKWSPYSFDFQCEIVQSCSLLHNFVCLNQLYEDEFYDVEINDPVVADDENEDDDVEGANIQALKIKRNVIANAMWVQFQINVAQNNNLL